MKNWKKHWKTLLGILAAIAVVAIGLLVLRNQNALSEADDFTQVVSVQRGDLVASITPTGAVTARQRIVLRFDVIKADLIELLVKAGQQVKEGDLLARIDKAELERALDQAEADLLSAEDDLEESLEPYTELDKKQAEVAVSKAKDALEQTRQKLQDLLDPDLDAAEKAVQDTKQDLQQTRDALVALQNDSSVDNSQIEILQWKADIASADYGGLLEQTHITEEGLDKQLLAYNRMLDTRESLEAAKARAALNLLNAAHKVVLAEEALVEAEENLAELRAGPDELALAEAQNKVTQAEHNLTKAQDDLSTILAGAQAKDIDLAQARYNAAKAKLEEAQEALENATMVAPFDGTVISTGAKVGDLVGSNSTIVTLADLTDLEIVASVDETTISKVDVGQQATITFDAFPGLRFQGEVLEVPLEGRLQSNIVTYDVRVSLEGAEDVAIAPGMTANLTISVGRTEDAMLVSALAIQQSEDGNVVMLQDAPGSYVVTPVQVGLSNGIWVEILRGLNEGDQVLVQYEQSTQPQFGALGGFMPGMGRMGR